MTLPKPYYRDDDDGAIAKELAEAIDELGKVMFGVGGSGWRAAKAEWWQRCVRAVERWEAKARDPELTR